MGKMNRLDTKLANGDEGRDCEVADWCHAPAYQLSATDKKIGNTLTTIQPIQRTIRYKCSNDHRFDKTFNLDIDLLTGKPAPKPSKSGEQ